MQGSDRTVIAASTEQLDGSVWHRALLYDGRRQYVDGVLRFVRAALDADRPVFVAVPDAHGQLLKEHLDGSVERVRFADMTAVGRNPSCIIPSIRAFVDEHSGDRVSFVGEPIWPGRTAAEIAEATRHEALINAAFEGTGAEVLCPYDVAGLGANVIADAFRTHPEVLDHYGRPQASDQYQDPESVWLSAGHLPPPPTDAQSLLVVQDDLPALRQAARDLATEARLPRSREDDLVLAVTELATNSIRHGGGSAAVTLWSESGRALCEVTDLGLVTDPLVGRRMPGTEATTGRGLWLVNHLCDLVQLHSLADGTTVRITISGDTSAG